jgi:hypothetical protein
MPVGGATISKLYLEVDPAADAPLGVQVLDNGAPVMTCNIPVGQRTCTTAVPATVIIPQGHYIQIQVLPGSPDNHFCRGSFRLG